MHGSDGARLRAQPHQRRDSPSLVLRRVEVVVGARGGLRERGERWQGRQRGGRRKGTRVDRGTESARRQTPRRSKTLRRCARPPALSPRPLFLHASSSLLLYRTVTLARSELACRPSGMFIALFGKHKWLRALAVENGCLKTFNPGSGS